MKKYLKSYLIKYVMTLIYVGENRLGTIGAIGTIATVGVFCYGLGITLLSTPYSAADWFVLFIIIIGLIPLIMALFIGFCRSQLNFPSIADSDGFELVPVYQIGGLLLLLKVIGVVSVFLFFCLLIVGLKKAF